VNSLLVLDLEAVLLLHDPLEAAVTRWITVHLKRLTLFTMVKHGPMDEDPRLLHLG